MKSNMKRAKRPPIDNSGKELEDIIVEAIKEDLDNILNDLIQDIELPELDINLKESMGLTYPHRGNKIKII